MEARQPFSRLGWALFAQMAVMLAAQWGVLLLARAARPGLLGEPVFLWAASVLGPDGLGIPAACLVLRGTAAPPAPAAVRWGRSASRPFGPAPWGWPIWRMGLPCSSPACWGGAPGRGGGQPVESIGLSPPSAPAPAGRAHRPCGGRNFCSAGCCCAACGPMGSALRWWPPPFASACFTEI